MNCVIWLVCDMDILYVPYGMYASPMIEDTIKAGKVLVKSVDCGT